MANRKPKLAVFWEVLAGDFRKQRARSNDAETGGGARDLRFRNEDIVIPKLLPMFPVKKSDREWSTTVYWERDGDSKVEDAEISLWSSTNARPNEARIGTIWRISKWTLDEQEYETAQANGEPWFYVLILDENGEVWANVIKDLSQQRLEIQKVLGSWLENKKGNMAARGIYDFVSKVAWP